MSKRCAHFSQRKKVKPNSTGCEDCLKTRDSWVHLRLCETCGHVGCCDASKNKHATKHFHKTNHPVIQSLEPGENWQYCYIDDLLIDLSPMDSYQGTGANSLHPEINLQATRISPGLANGIAWIVGDILDSNLEASRIELDQVDAEMERIRAAFARVENELEESARRISEQLDPKLAEIFRAHQLMLQSLLSSNEFENELRESLTTAATVVRSVFRKWEAKFAAIENEIVRQNADDILDIARRVLRQLEAVEAYGLAAMPPGSVLVTERLVPSDVIAASMRDVKAIVVESLGQGSHAALLARENNIPTLAGLPSLLSNVQKGDQVLVDAFREQLVISPTADTQREFQLRLEEYRATLLECKWKCHLPAVTHDGETISVQANFTAHMGVDSVMQNGADGVGLFRIEQLYLARELPPSEEELFNELQRLVSPLRQKHVTMRLLDIGGDKSIPFLQLPLESNPLLGKRGVRVLLDYPQLARTQIRVFLRLSQTQDIRVLVPMVTLERDMQQIRDLFVKVAQEMGIEKLPPLGAMIETPAAALTVGEIIRHADFLSVGTNDLTQYTLAAGRDSTTVSDYYKETHPSILRLLSIIIQEATEKPVTICGELAGRVEAIPTLLDLGFRALSIAPPLIPTTKEFIRSIDARKQQL